MQVTKTDNPEILVPLLEQWIDHCAVEEYGLRVSIELVMTDLKAWIEQYPSAIFVTRHKGEIVGLIIVFALHNYLSDKPVVIEKYWYGQGGLELFKAAKKWAKEQGCGHFIASESHLAGNGHARIGKLCERLGMKRFETSYITEV